MSATIIELTAGFIIGNWFVSIEAAKAISGISEIGALALFFLVGFHTSIRDVRTFRRDIAAVVGIGAITSLAAMGVLYEPLKLSPPEALFAAATIMATGVGVIMRVLQEYNYAEKPAGRLLLACATAEDFPAIILLSFASSFSAHNASSVQMLSSLMLKIILGIACIFVAKFFISYKKISSIPLPLIFPLIIVAAWATNSLGFTSLLGAFLVGIFCKHKDTADYEVYTKPVMDFFIPIFFITVGMHVKLETLMEPESWMLAAVLVFLAFTSKLLCFLGIKKKSRTLGIDPWIIAFGMLPRGLPGLVFATIALNSGFIRDTVFSALIIMVTATNTIGLTLLSRRLKTKCI